MTSIGIVKSKSTNKVLVTVARKGSCGENCASCNICDNSDIVVKAYCKIDVNIGDRVEVSSKTSYVLFGMLSLFILPIILPLILYIVLYNYNDIAALVVTILSFAFSILLVWKLSKSEKYITKITPQVIRIVDKY